MDKNRQDRLDAEEELLEKLAGVPPSRRLRIMRRKPIVFSAKKIFPQLRKNEAEYARRAMIEFDPRFKNSCYYPCAVDEFPHFKDPLAKMANIFIPDKAVSPESTRECTTCGEIRPVVAFYNYGSPSCRDCNMKGPRGEE